jgi:hypothetical protein
MTESTEGTNIHEQRSVTLANGDLGMEMKALGSSFELRYILTPSQLGSDQFSRLYLRTQSGNIYRIDKFQGKVRIINANESKRKHELLGQMVKPEELMESKITVGQPATLAGSLVTTPVTEIVASSEKTVGKVGAQKAAQVGQMNSIDADFREGLPPVPASRLQGMFEHEVE